MVVRAAIPKNISTFGSMKIYMWNFYEKSLYPLVVPLVRAINPKDVSWSMHSSGNTAIKG
jgi:hypothetical protein